MSDAIDNQIQTDIEVSLLAHIPLLQRLTNKPKVTYVIHFGDGDEIRTDATEVFVIRGDKYEQR